MKYVLWFWNDLLGIPLQFLHNTLGMDIATPWKAISWKIAIVVGGLLLSYELYLRIRRAYRRRVLREHLLTPEEAGALVKDSRFRDNIEATRDPSKVIGQLKKERRWADLAAVFSAIKRHRQSAYYYRKVGMLPEAANEWAKAGKPVKAARLLQKAGDHETAARFYLEKNKYRQAAQAYTKAGDLPKAAAAFGMAGKVQDAVQSFKQYFAEGGSPSDQLAAADACYQFLQSPNGKNKVDAELRKELSCLVAERFAADNRLDLAASLFLEGGNAGRAGEVFLKAGRLEEAAKSFQQAGRVKEAAEIGGRYYESKGRWREAAMAYQGAGQFRRAGDCFSKAQLPEDAAKCYEEGGEYFGAGFALVHLKQYDKAITMFQKVREDHPRFAESRALLGRCFYEMKDYSHSAATLENYLTGERVTSDNKDYFYMLALAFEQLGELQKSRDLLLKIRSVDVEFRDVSGRLSNIETRISLVQSGAGRVSQGGDAPKPQQQATAIMDLVESSLGQRYRLERELGRGGMGVVYEAFDNQLDRKVAIKFLGALVDGSDEYRERFIREAKAAAKVNHPNIIGIYDIGTDQGKVFIAMEYVEGPNLHKYLQRKGKLEAREAVNIIGQACSALEAVHQAGIIHRDIKPDNILIASGGLVKLMDFGLAKSEGGKLTGTNVVMGTPCYMSPEQAKGKPVDVRSDIYAIGLVLYELLTGKTVFIDGDVLARQVNEMPPAPSTVVDGVPVLVDQIVLKCIAKKPEERFQSVKELMGYLRQVGKS